MARGLGLIWMGCRFLLGTKLSVDSSQIERLALSDEKGAASLRIIADHARAATFLISDGVQPANEGRGYVLRKILRRGIRHGRLLGQEKPFMHEMVLAVRDEMAVAYPELKETAERVAKVVLAEEEQFARVIERGSVELDPGQLVTIPRGVRHRTRPVGARSVNLTFELAQAETVGV